MTGTAVLSCALAIVLFTGVRSQVCTRLVKMEEPMTVSYTAKGKICPTCPVTKMSKTLLGNVSYEYIAYECCHGYKKKIQTLNPSSDNCVPVNCETQCVNGRCSTQDECECYTGFEKHPTHNTCIDKCDVGYIRVSKICVPHCNKPCRGGRCVAPDTCSCDQGWTLNMRGECIEISPDSINCYPPCGNGTCEYGNRCNCRDGYEFNENANPRCIPICKNCQGHCVSPGRCECPEYQERKYLTADDRDCHCSEDCNTKCRKTLCVPATTSSSNTSTLHETDRPSTLSAVSLFATAFYLSLVANIILIIIIGIILRKKIYAKCKTGAGEIKNNVSETYVHYTDMTGARQNSRELQKYEYIPENAVPGCSDQYVPMGDVHRNKLADHHQYESIQDSKCAGAGALCYDYVQTPLPIHLRQGVQGVPRRG